MDKVRVDNLESVTRFEVVDDEGRLTVLYNIEVKALHLQDEGRTLKVFVGPRERDRNV